MGLLGSWGVFIFKAFEIYFQIILQNPYVNLDFAGVYMCQCFRFKKLIRRNMCFGICILPSSGPYKIKELGIPGYPSRISSSTKYKYILVSLLFSGRIKCMWHIFICTNRAPSLCFLTAGQNLRNRDSTSCSKSPHSRTCP